MVQEPRARAWDGARALGEARSWDEAGVWEGVRAWDGEGESGMVQLDRGLELGQEPRDA